MKRHDVKILSCCKARSDHGFPLIESVHAIELPEIPRDDRHTRGDCSNDRNHRAMPGTVIIGGENPRLFIDDLNADEDVAYLREDMLSPHLRLMGHVRAIPPLRSEEHTS